MSSEAAAVIDRLWAQYEPTAFITREQFVRSLDGWDIEPFVIDGQLSFVTATKGPDFHFTSFNTGAQITKEIIRKWLSQILAHYGYVTTRTPKQGADRQHRFNRAFGFHVSGEDEFFISYRLENKCL